MDTWDRYSRCCIHFVKTDILTARQTGFDTTLGVEDSRRYGRVLGSDDMQCHRTEVDMYVRYTGSTCYA
eukprot:530510-Rhodomonas_salina.7